MMTGSHNCMNSQGLFLGGNMIGGMSVMLYHNTMTP